MKSRPPRIGVALLDRLGCDEALVGDIIEEFDVRGSKLGFWWQALCALVLCIRHRSARVRRFPLGVMGDPDEMEPVPRQTSRRSINLSASPSPYVGGLGILSLGIVMTAVRPEGWFLLLGGAMCGVALGLARAAIRDRRLLSATIADRPARLVT